MVGGTDAHTIVSPWLPHVTPFQAMTEQLCMATPKTYQSECLKQPHNGHFPSPPCMHVHANTFPPLPVHPHNYTPVMCMQHHLQQNSSVRATLTAGRCTTTDRVPHNSNSFFCSLLYVAHKVLSQCMTHCVKLSH